MQSAAMAFVDQAINLLLEGIKANNTKHDL